MKVPVPRTPCLHEPRAKKGWDAEGLGRERKIKEENEGENGLNCKSHGDCSGG